MTDNKPFQVSDDDVVSMQSNWSYLGTPTFKLGQFGKAIAEHLGNSVLPKWFGEGVECELLLTTGGGWQKGKIRVRFEFVPDAVEEENTETPSATDSSQGD